MPDDATVALMAKHFLSGEAFPAFYYRQTYIGSLSGVLLVPALFLFGPSVLLVRLSAVASSLLFPLALYVLGRRVFDEATARAALLLGAVPPFLLAFWSAVNESHFMTNTFGVVLLLLALAASEAQGARYARLLACFGLTAGLAWWANFKVLEILLPALVVLLIRNPWLPLSRAGAYLAGGFLLGSLPAWLFYATHGDPPGQASRLFETQLVLSADRLSGLLATARTMLLGWYYWPPDIPLRGAAGLATIGVYATAIAAVLADLVRQPRERVFARREWGIWLLLLTLVTPFAMLYVARYANFESDTTRLVLPIYIPCLLFVGALVVRLWRRSRVWGAALLGFLLAYNVWTNVPFMWPLIPVERARRSAHIAARQAILRYLEAHPAEALYVDGRFTSPGWAFLLTGTPVSELTSEIYLPNALAADATERVAFLIEQPDDNVVEALDRLGVTYRTTRFGEWRLLDEIRVPAREYRLIPRTAWRVRGAPDGLPAVADGDLATAWPPESGPGQTAMVLDLGASYSLGRVIWWPATDLAHSLPLAMSVSSDGTRWTPIGVLPTRDRDRRPAFVAGGRPFFRPRNGWLEVRLDPRPARYLRFAPADPAAKGPWGIAEVYAYEDAGPGPDPRLDSEGLVTRLRAHGVTRLLADPAVSAGVARATQGAIRTLTANGFLDSHGRDTPPARLAQAVRIQPTDGLLVPQEDAGDLRTRLATARVEFREEPIGEHVLFRGLSPVASVSEWAWAGRTLFVHSGSAE